MNQPEDPRFRDGRRPPRSPATRPARRPARRPAARPQAPSPGRKEETGPPGTERLQKVLADSGIASRRDCELAIRAGRIRVNGRTVRELPCWVVPANDLVELDGEIVDITRRARLDQSYLYFAANKPKGVISTARDPEGRPHVVGLVSAAVPRGQRVYPVGRLDADSTGLVLLTNDGELAHRLSHPRYGVSKDYRVTVEGVLNAEVIASLKRGMYLADSSSIARSKGTGRGGGAKRAAVDALRVLKSSKDRRTGGLSLLAITLSEGQNREIRRLLARVGLKVRKLERVSIGPLQLKGLKPGSYRALTPAEVAALRKAVLI
jgi:23S rRNA pseudouridine2605 synthase